MNFLAHAEVVRRLAGSNDEVVLGAMLPDLAHLIGARFERQSLPADVAAGWACHVAADRVFHADERFRRGVSELSGLLEREGWRRWPAQAAAHVAWELSLDGCLVKRSDPTPWFSAALRSAPFAEGLNDAERDAWNRLVAVQRRRPLWRSYLDSATVADRTWRRVLVTRVAFDQSRVPQLTAALEAQSRDIERLAEPIVDAVVAAVGPLALLPHP